MSTIADYSILTKAFLASNNVDFSELHYPPLSQENSLRYFAVVPLALETPLTPLEAVNFDWSKLGSGLMWNRVSCRNTNGEFIGNIVRVQPGVREGSIRLVAKVAVPAANEGDVEDIQVKTFVLLRTDASTTEDLPIAVATISKGYRLHKHLASGNDPLDDVENANYVSFTINHLNGYTSVDFNPDAYATYDDVANALSRGIDGLHIAFDTASGDLKLLDKDGNVLDQANLPIKTDVIIADGEEGYKYVKTDVKQDIHAAKAWMPKDFTAWEDVKAVPYTMRHAALVVGKGSTTASRVFVSEKPFFGSPISTNHVPLEHVVIGDSTYLLVDRTGTGCHLRKVKGNAEAPIEISAGISEGKVTLNDSLQPYPISNNDVEVDVIEYNGTTYVLVGPEISGRFKTQPISGDQAGKYTDAISGTIVTFGGSTTASRVFVDPDSGSYPISTEPVGIPHVVIGGSTYMLADLKESTCNLFRVKGDAGIRTYYDVSFSEDKVTITDASTTEPASHDVLTSDVDVDVITFENTLYVLGEAGNHQEDLRYRALPTNSGGNNYIHGVIVTVTSEGSSADRVLGITPDGKNLYTFDETAQTPAEITSISGEKVRWLDIKPLTEVPNHTLKYGLEAFVWTVKDREVELNEPFFRQLNASLLALGFHEGDDIALGTNLATLAPADLKTSPLNGVDADDYIHGKNNKATREQEVDDQRKFAKEELVAWNEQRPALTGNPSEGTIIDHTGLDVRHGSITLGCGHLPVGEEGESTKVNYGIQMGDSSESLDFTVSHHTGPVQFDENGHAIGLTSSTLLSIEAGDYISGAPTCLILAEVTNSSGTPWVTPIRTTTGFECVPSYDASSGSRLKIHDYRNNIAAVFNPYNYEPIPAIIEVQAIYTHSDAQSETVPAQQMHTYIGEWKTISAVGAPDHPCCSFLCNKIEEWMTAVGLTDTNPVENVKLYVVIRVY